jgi:hypothetical protein
MLINNKKSISKEEKKLSLKDKNVLKKISKKPKNINPNKKHLILNNPLKLIFHNL